MHIELIGCTGAGKSSLIQEILRAHHPRGSRLVTSHEFVLAWAHLNGVRDHRLRRLFLNLLALGACLLTWRQNRGFYRFVAGVIVRLPTQVGLLEKLKIARIAARNAGIFEIVRRHPSEGQVVLADEGTLHIAHYLFVHVAVAPSLADLETFARLVSLPDVVVYLRQPESVLVSRTVRRGHKRIPKGQAALARQFIQHGVVVFEKLIACSSLADRLVILQHGEVLRPAQETLDAPRLAFTRKLLELHPPHPHPHLSTGPA